MRVAVVVVFVGAVAASGPARAFLCTRTPGTGPSVAWQERSIVIQRSGGSADVDDAAIDEALAAGAAAWTDVDCSDLAVTVGPPTAIRTVGFDWARGSDDPLNQNIVVFRNSPPGGSPADPLDEWVHTFGALAITTVTFESTSGRLLDADIEVNDVSFDFTSCDAPCDVAFDLRNTLTHELGHVIGLDHPPLDQADAALATMFASAARGDTDKRDLGDDDVAAVCTVYPAGAPVGECFGVGRTEPPAVRFEQTLCANAGPDGAGLAVGLLVLLRRRSFGRKGDGARRDPLA